MNATYRLFVLGAAAALTASCGIPFREGNASPLDVNPAAPDAAADVQAQELANPDAGAGAEADDASSGSVTPATCDPPDTPAAPGATCLLEARGLVTDLDGQPLAHVGMSLCGDICFGGTTDATGTFNLKIDKYLDLDAYALHINGRPLYSDVYLRLARANATLVTMPTTHLPLLPTDGPSFPDNGTAGTIQSGPVTLVFASGTDTRPGLGDPRVFRATNVPLASAPPFGLGKGLAALYALAPFGAKTTASVAVVVANDAHLPSGAAVDIVVLDGSSTSLASPGGDLTLSTPAHVSADGASIASDPGGGIDQITWIGVKPHAI